MWILFVCLSVCIFVGCNFSVIMMADLDLSRSSLSAKVTERKQHMADQGIQIYCLKYSAGTFSIGGQQ